MHISSIVVHADPPSLARVSAAIDALAGVQTHASTPEGKLVVTIEAPTEGESIARMDEVHALAGVLAVAMVFHQFESDPELEL